MPFMVPDFAGTRCLGIAVCGEIDLAPESVKDFLEEMIGERFWAKYLTQSGADALLRVAFGGISETHVHIDATKSEIISEDDRSGEKSLSEVIDYLAKLQGSVIIGRTYGRYILPIGEIPRDGIIASTIYEREEEDVSLRISDARCEIEGAPIRSLAWSITEDKTIIIDVEAAVSDDTFADDYLAAQLALIDSGFRVFVMGEKRHGEFRP